MRVHNDTSLRPAWLVAALTPGQLSASWVVKGTFRLQPGAPAIAVDEPPYPDGDRLHETPEAGLKWESDFAPVKPRTDLLLTGTCHPPGGRPATVCQVSFGVGRWKKTLAVVGDRQWRRSAIGLMMGDPRPFTSMPLNYGLAYGGTGYARNPIGRGFRTEMLPNIEFPDRPVMSPDADVEPAGFGPLMRTWPQRSSRLGSYGPEWLKTRWPWFPDDFDWSYFNAAPRDQQVASFPRGNEKLWFEHLHPAHARYESQLPGIRPQVFVVDNRGVREVPLRLDTIAVDADTETLTLLWRGALPVQTIKLTELREVYVAHAAVDEAPLTADEVLGRVARRTAEAAEAKRQAAAAQADEAAAMEAAEARNEQEVAALLAEARGRADVAAATLSQELAALGLPAFPALGGAVELPPQPALRDVLKDALADPRFAPLAERLLANVENAPEEEDDRPWTRDRCLGHASAGGSFAGRDLSGLDLSAVDLSGCNFSGTQLTGAQLNGARCVGCDFSRADLSDAVLTDADLRRSDFSRADLSGAQASGVRFDDAVLERTTLSKALLTGASLRRVKADRADFSEADLSDAWLAGGHFFKTGFTAATLVKADFTAAVLEHAVLQQVQASMAVFDRADIRSLHAGNQSTFSAASFQDCHGDASYWESATLDHADFSGASLVRADFDAASLTSADFSGADLQHASLSDARLDRAQLRGANLFRAGLQRTSLVEADLRQASLFEADVWDADLTDATLEGANLQMTKLSGQA